jgi:replicative DNA helicase
MDTEEAYSVMKKGILQVESEIVDSTTVNITEDVDDRKKLYEERKLNKGIIGIPTGIEKLDFLIKGLQRKTLVTLIAKTGTGKTWLEVILGSHACLNNFRVLQFVTEMSEEQMRDRYEAVLIGKLLGEFNYTRFKSGLLSAKEEDKYYEFLDKHLPRLEPLFIETADGVSSVASKIQQHSPDLVLIDSAYLMEDERNAKDDWLRVAHISRDLKLLCKRAEVPIFINTQADSTTSKKTGPELENIAFAKSIGQDSDIVAALFQDDQMREDKEMKLKILKQREGCLGSVMLNWDLTKMNFNSIYSTVEQEVDNSDNNGFEQPAGLIEMEDEE